MPRIQVHVPTITLVVNYNCLLPSVIFPCQKVVPHLQSEAVHYDSSQIHRVVGIELLIMLQLTEGVPEAPSD